MTAQSFLSVAVVLGKVVEEGDREATMHHRMTSWSWQVK
jgi:hypothetical protein